MSALNKFNKVLVVGGSGFLGRHLIEGLLDAGFTVSSLDLIKPNWLDGSVGFYEGCFTTSSLLEEALSDCDIVFHLASTTLPKLSNEDPLFDISTNLLGTVELLNFAVQKRIRKFVFISSGGTVYGAPTSVPVHENHSTNPICSYGIVKLSIEKYLRLYHRLHGLETVSLRVSNPYGEHQRVDKSQGAISVFCHKALKGETIEIWGDGSVVRDFIYVKDVVQSMLKALESDCAGMEINVGYGSGASIDEVLFTIETSLGHKVDRKYFPARSFDVPEIYLDIGMAKSILDWTPELQLQDGIDLLLKWMKSSRPAAV